MKQQLLIINRHRKRAPRLTPLDRFLLGFWSLFLIHRRIQQAAVIIRPSTLLKFHQLLKQRKYRLLYSSARKTKPGPKGPSKEIIDAVVELKRRNPQFGCPRIAQQINHAFGISIDKDVVRRILTAHYLPDPGGSGPSWLTFLGHTKDSLWSIDLFRCESIRLRSHWVLVIMDQFTRRIIGFGVHQGDVDGVALCCLFNQAISSKGIPKYLSSDNDPLFRYHQWQANLRILEIEEIKSIPYTPTSHPFIERLIGNRVEERFVGSFWIICSSGTRMTLNGNWRPFANTTTSTEFIKRSMGSHRRLSAVMSNINVLNSVSIRGSHTATDFFRLQSPREV